MSGFRVAVTVFVIAEGVNHGDAGNVAERAVTDVLAEVGNGMTVRTPSGIKRAVQVVEVMETRTAAANGYLSVRPAARAFPRGEDDDTA
jgi:hypothetical protein